MTKPTTNQRIPAFKTLEEEAVFWDNHDTAEFAKEWTPVEVRFAKPLSEGLTIRLDRQTLTQLRQQARKKGIGPTTLIRMWVLEHLHHEYVA